MAENSNIKKPHDKLFKKVFGDPAVAADFLRAHVPTHILQQANLATLQLTNKSFVTEAFQDRHSDLVFRLDVQDTSGYAYVLLEHQSSQDDLMLLRLLEYNACLMREHVTQYKQKQKKLPLVLNVIICNDEKPYKGPTNLMDMFEQPELAQKLMFRECQLVDLYSTPEKELIDNKKAALVELVMKQGKFRDFCKWISKNKLVLAKLGEDCDYLHFAWLYVANLEPHSKKKIVNLIEGLGPQHKEAMATVAQQFIQEGMQRGMQQGILTTAKSMLKRGLELDLIRDITGFSLKKLKELQRDLSQ